MEAAHGVSHTKDNYLVAQYRRLAARRDIEKKWTMPIPNWAMILNQLAIHFEDRFPV